MRYTGVVGSAPIELTLVDQEYGSFEGVYAYTRFNTPIALHGTLKQGSCRLVESNSHGKATAALTIPQFTTTAQKVAGTWKNLVTGQQLPVALVRLEDEEPSSDAAEAPHELLQVTSLPNSYFKIVLTGRADAYDGHIKAVRVFDKKTNRLVQQVPVDCQSHGLYSVSVGDFNFDGYPDFSVFESSYAGPNTSSLYFLFNPVTRRYMNSGFEGTSLKFDARKKRIYENNTCCAGTSVVEAEYKLVHNRMVLVAEHCYRWDDKKRQLVERKASACR
ncbi:hypothetical protein GCM10022409_33150 [Hymenobacter glaciei]|uniref:Uncharacterized protein n=1 Tax=Hymenobacter glaciei TaxID=877209 RepID=A0ABP7UJM4_9BACT